MQSPPCAKVAPGRIFLGGHSYGGRQSTMLCAEEPAWQKACCCFPIHCIRRASRNNFAPSTCPVCTLQACSWKAHVDPFGSVEEIEKAIA